jgi:outer membrane protein OmpA-like peptidoglycan-associated protein
LNRFIFTLLFIVSITANAFQMKRESYIDIPTANLNQGLYVNVNSSYPITDVEDVKFDPNIGIDLSYKKFGVAIKWYDGADFALDVSYQILRDNGVFPAFAIGINELATSEYVSSAGNEDVFNDEDYADRSPEISSAYIVGTKKFSRNFEATAGIGRGKFVGYGPVSKYANTDAFFDENHEDWAFGLFGGMRIIFTNNLAFLAEGDGRDMNVGLKYQNKIIKATLALSKLEVFNDEEGDLSPRVGLDFSYRIIDLQEEVRKEKRKFPVVIELVDEESRELMEGYVIISGATGDTVEVSEFKDVHSFKLEPGIYTIFVSVTGYKDKKLGIVVKEEISKNLHTVEMSKIEEVMKAEDSVKVIDNFKEVKDQVEGISIRFFFREADLTTRARGILNRIIELIINNEDVHLLVIGHTCSVGTTESNQILSKKRAENVKEYLMGHGIPAGSISTKGYGETRPIADNSTEEGRIKNRRVEFILYRDKE